MGRNLIQQNSGECSRASEHSKSWTSLWSLNALQIVKVFLWKACNNLLPTKENLFKKRVVKDPLCPICGVEVENICHMLWRCPSSCDV
jgi:hypothetical protein